MMDDSWLLHSHSQYVCCCVQLWTEEQPNVRHLTLDGWQANYQPVGPSAISTSGRLWIRKDFTNRVLIKPSKSANSQLDHFHKWIATVIKPSKNLRRVGHHEQTFVRFGYRTEPQKITPHREATPNCGSWRQHDKPTESPHDCEVDHS